jgi:hypothetical protein
MLKTAAPCGLQGDVGLAIAPGRALKPASGKRAIASAAHLSPTE